MAATAEETWRSHWKCFVACGIIVLSPFQYGVDFGLIGGLQAMPGFLKVEYLLFIQSCRRPLPGSMSCAAMMMMMMMMNG